MGFSLFSSAAADARQLKNATLEAITRAHAIIGFAPDGTVLDANAVYLALSGYTADELVGRSYTSLVPPEDVAGPDFARLWSALQRGEQQSAHCRRVGKSGRSLWLQTSYCPVSEAGRLKRIVAVSSDVTPLQTAGAEARGQIAALSRSHAVIEFSLGGEILSANANFCATMGYALDEMRGKHHRMFMRPEDAASRDYAAFWERLGRGEFVSGQFCRLGKDGHEVWLEASYNPVFDLDGKPFKIVKYAIDVTRRHSAVTLVGERLGQLAGGDLATTIEAGFSAELEPVRLAYNHTVATFAGIVDRLRGTSGSLRTATAEILSGANDLAHRTARQAAAIEQTSAAMRELAGTVNDNALRAETASGKARSVAEAAGQGGDVMRRANEAMEQITASSAKISSIIGLIDDIAFQTNLLALNASVEAARAGDAGRGFAVVAIEVRRLAQSAARASSDVKALIEQSSGEVRNGSRLVTQAVDRLSSVLEGVRESSALVDSIAQASKNQSDAISEVSAAVREMDEMTQHNAALVEETNAAIEQTETQARELDHIVEVFRLAPEAARGRPEPRPAPRPPAEATRRPVPDAVQRRYLSDGNAAVADDWAEF